MRSRLLIAGVAIILSAGLLAYGATTAGGSAVVITIDGPIGPATSDYVTSALHQAATQNARVVILRLDTPGGLATSMRDIIQAILASPVPVIGYVAPSGARAASAGTYILYATQTAAMAPTTNLGAATPVPLMGGEKSPSKMTAEQRKVLNDSVAYIRALAERHGRNAAWAEKAVREAASLPAEEALKKHVVDLIAPSMAVLLDRVDGRQVSVNGKPVVLQTAQLTIRTIEPDWRTKFLSVLTNPTLAYLLFLGGILGIGIEATHPGFIFPGVVGGICLLFALFAFQVLPVNYAGLALMLFGIGLMIAEAFVTSFGTLGLGGVAAFVIGSILLMNTHAPGFTVSLAVIAGVGAAISICILLLIMLAVRAHRRAVVTGAPDMIGEIALPLAAFTDLGQVRVHGEIWRARAAGHVKKNQRLKVVRMEGLTLDVEPLDAPPDDPLTPSPSGRRLG
ncbi:MAG TPA: nodulation protein NfeD [Gammaproteobacteria bacterium]|nr:nodulation protein NfeD [Gammaproteobacteria bacterium]